MRPSIPLLPGVTKGALTLAVLFTLWLAKSVDSGVVCYVMDGADEIGEVQRYDGGYVVRLDHEDAVLVVPTLWAVLPAVQRRLTR